MTSAVLLRGVDRAAFAVSFSAKLRAASVPVSLSRTESFTRALEVCEPRRLSRLYWTARTTLICDQRYLGVFDEVFTAVFNDAVIPLDPHARRQSSGSTSSNDDSLVRVQTGTNSMQDSEGLPWITLPRAVEEASNQEDTGLQLPERLPGRLEQAADVPFEDLSPEDLVLAGSWLEAASGDWPTRRSRRNRASPTGNKIALRR
ncbi:MAG: CoxE, partial [Acidimicrobiales bacterium]